MFIKEIILYFLAMLSIIASKNKKAPEAGVEPTPPDGK